MARKFYTCACLSIKDRADNQETLLRCSAIRGRDDYLVHARIIIML